jgi:hypothetical protein
LGGDGVDRVDVDSPLLRDFSSFFEYGTSDDELSRFVEVTDGENRTAKTSKTI